METQCGIGASGVVEQWHEATDKYHADRGEPVEMLFCIGTNTFALPCINGGQKT